MDVVDLSETYTEAHFDACSSRLKRSKKTCHEHWHTYLLPILKTYHLGSPSFPENYYDWITSVMEYIVKNRVDNIKDLDFQDLKDKVCPGQTYKSIRNFINNLNSNYSRNTSGKLEADTIGNLHQKATTRLENPRANFVADALKNAKIEKIKNIIDIYISKYYNI